MLRSATLNLNHNVRPRLLDMLRVRGNERCPTSAPLSSINRKRRYLSLHPIATIEIVNYLCPEVRYRSLPGHEPRMVLEDRGYYTAAFCLYSPNRQILPRRLVF